MTQGAVDPNNRKCFRFFPFNFVSSDSIEICFVWPELIGRKTQRPHRRNYCLYCACSQYSIFYTTIIESSGEEVIKSAWPIVFIEVRVRRVLNPPPNTLLITWLPFLFLTIFSFSCYFFQIYNCEWKTERLVFIPVEKMNTNRCMLKESRSLFKSKNEVKKHFKKKKKTNKNKNKQKQK